MMPTDKIDDLCKLCGDRHNPAEECDEETAAAWRKAAENQESAPSWMHDVVVIDVSGAEGAANRKRALETAQAKQPYFTDRVREMVAETRSPDEKMLVLLGLRDELGADIAKILIPELTLQAISHLLTLGKVHALGAVKRATIQGLLDSMIDPGVGQELRQAVGRWMLLVVDCDAVIVTEVPS